MLKAGDVYLVVIPGAMTDHYWIMATDVDVEGRIAYAMLTDARNLDFASFSFPKGTAAWNNFVLTKETAVDAARANIHNAATVEKALVGAGHHQGTALPGFLKAVQKALRTAPETPTAVKKAL